MTLGFAKSARPMKSSLDARPQVQGTAIRVSHVMQGLFVSNVKSALLSGASVLFVQLIGQLSSANSKPL